MNENHVNTRVLSWRFYSPTNGTLNFFSIDFSLFATQNICSTRAHTTAIRIIFVKTEAIAMFHRSLCCPLSSASLSVFCNSFFVIIHGFETPPHIVCFQLCECMYVCMYSVYYLCSTVSESGSSDGATLLPLLA